MNRPEVIRRIVARELEQRGLAAEEVLKDDAVLYQRACDQFGTWETALQYAGVTPRRQIPETVPVPRHKRSITVPRNADPTEVVNALRSICVNGYNLSASKNSRRDRKLYDAARRHFGTWARALIAAGINLENSQLPVKPRRLSRIDLLARMHGRLADGRSMAWRQVCLEDRAFAMAVKHAFKSWHRALLAAGIVVVKAKRISPDGE